MSRRLPLPVLAATVLAATVLAVGSAAGATRLVAHLVTPSAPVPERSALASNPASSPARQPAAALDVERAIDGIMGRNLFDISALVAWNAAPPPSGDKTSSLPVTLLSTLVAEPASLSSAFISDDPLALPAGYSIGDTLRGWTIDAIEDHRVALALPDGSIEWLSMDETARAETPDASAVTGGEGVTKLDENTYVISRALFDANINDMGALSQMARAQPHQGPDGKPDGFRLTAVRKGTLADQLGIKNGDIVRSVNGQPLRSMPDAMAAFGSLQTQSRFCFEISQRGSPTERCYEVR